MSLNCGVIVHSCWLSKVDSSSSLVQYRSYVQFSGSVHMDFFFSIRTERLIWWWSQVSIVFRSDYTLEGDHSDSTISTITEPYLSPEKVMHWLVMCRLGLEALSRPKLALGSRARPELQWWLHEAYVSGFNSVKPELQAWAAAHAT